MARIDSLLAKSCEHRASDLHLRGNSRPRFRIDGKLEEFEEDHVLSSEEIVSLIEELIDPQSLECFKKKEEIDFSYGSESTGRFRCNYFLDYRGPAAALRLIPKLIRTLGELNMPESLESFAHLKSGLVLITGPTNCGKSSTLAALVSIINRSFRKHIITLEDPIEYIYKSQKSIVHQRGLYHDFLDFKSGLLEALHEDPDVLLVGEMRDLESISLALTAAETGVLVFSTLHTVGAAQSIDRVYDVYPEDEQAAVRTLLSQSLEGVISQVLLKRIDEPGRIPATEILVANPALRNMIREGKTQDIANSLLAGKSQGMHPFSESLERLVVEKKVDMAEALTYSGARDRLERNLQLKRTTASM
ncbi:MAG TPA: PilT/PilU family type 4a pilus ATPase [Planctomycetota bacterium]|nr:PilT/PilU family type 4a pilus ATPase [Planctomycetota bacterium]